MIRHFTALTRGLLLATSVALLPFQCLRSTAADSSEAPATNSIYHEIMPGPYDGRIAFLTASLLAQYHYSHHPFDDTISSEFLDGYLEALDPQHLHFIQSDLDDFEQYRTSLDSLTINRSQVANTRPAYVIFSRFMQRLRERVAYVDELLKTEEFEFKTNERIMLDRHDLPYPKDLTEAKALWRDRLRFEYLQEKLGLDSKKTNSAPAAASVAKTEAPKSVHDQIVDTLTRRYHRTERLFEEEDNEDVLSVYLTALSHVYDPHSDYFNKAQLDQFKISMDLELFGIGAELYSDQDGYCKIRRLLPGPAAKSKKIHEGDRIIAVAQSNQPPVDVVDMGLTKIVQMIRGPKGTEVRLTLMPEGANSVERPVVTIVRDEIPLEDQAAKGKIIDLPNDKGEMVRLGVINLPSFYAPMNLGDQRPLAAADSKGGSSGYTSVDVARLLAKFKEEKVGGVILDLRYNGGGSLEEAIRLTGLFIKDGPVVQVRDQDNRVSVDRDDDPSIAYGGPLIVLTSRFSASASEIVTGALQDYGRALIVGDVSTHGKGTVQTVSRLNDLFHLDDSQPDRPGALKFTIRKFYRASGASTQLKGVLPDIVLPSKWNYSKDVGESSLEHPLAWDTIPSAKYDKLDMVQPYLPELLKRSTERVATNQDFVYVREDITEFRKQQDDKSISLNEKERLDEMHKAEARQKARDKELLARKEPDDKIYDITLKLTGVPGLPPAEAKTNATPSNVTSTSNGGSTVVKVMPGDTRTATGTNAVIAAAPALPETLASGDDSDSDEIPPTVDADLDEAERILQDYITLLPKQSGLVATQVP